MQHRCRLVGALLGMALVSVAAGGDCYVLRSGTSDLDQRRSAGGGSFGLPGNGKAYCFPATWVSWMAYLNQNGFPSAMGSIPAMPDWSDPAVYDHVTLQMAEMGFHCHTDAEGGTGNGDGVLDYLAQYGLGDKFTMWRIVIDWTNPAEFVTPFVSPADMTYHLRANRLVSIAIGWSDWVDEVHWGDGSHVTGIVGTLGDCAQRTVLMHDPASGDSPLMQSPFVTQYSDLFLRIGEYQRGSNPIRTKAMWEFSDYADHRAHLLGIRVLAPAQGVVIPETLDQLIVFIPSPIGGGEPESSLMAIPEGSQAFHAVTGPGGRGAVVALERTDGAREISWSVDGVCHTIIPDVVRPFFVTDRFGDFYAQREGPRMVRRRIQFDEYGAFVPVTVAEAVMPDTFSVVQVNDGNDALYAVGAAEAKVFMLSRDLDVLAAWDMPGPIPVGDEVSMAFNRDGTRLWLVSNADDRAFEFEVYEDGALDILDGHTLPGLVNPRRIQVTDAGRLLVTADEVHEYSRDPRTGAWVESNDTGFGGLTGVHAMAMSRSRSNAPRTTPEEDPDLPHVVPAEAVPLCPADLDDDRMVAVTDLLDVLAHWGSCDIYCPGDATQDGTVDVGDLLLILSEWGPCPE